MVDFPSGVSATNPTFLLGANATDPAKAAITAFGQTVIDRADAASLRTLAEVPTFTSVGTALAVAVDAAAGRTALSVPTFTSLGSDIATAATGAEVQTLIGIPNPIGARVGPLRYTEMEHFLNNTTGMKFGLVSSTSGGANGAINVDGRFGVLRSTTGSAAAINQRAGVLGGSTPVAFGTNAYRIVVNAAPTVALLTGALTGAIRIGFIDSSTAESTDGAFFRSTDGGNWFAVTRSNNTETATDTGIALSDLDVYQNFDIRVNADGTSVTFYIDDVLYATITTNIPTGSTRALGVGFFIIRTVATGTSVGMATDWLYFDTIYTTDLGFTETP